jgi:hypothetical protein
MKRRLHLRMMTIDKMLKILGIVHVLLEEEIRSTEEQDKGTPEWLERFKMQFIHLDFGDDPYTATERTLMTIGKWSDKINSADALSRQKACDWMLAAKLIDAIVIGRAKTLKAIYSTTAFPPVSTTTTESELHRWEVPDAVAFLQDSDILDILRKLTLERVSIHAEVVARDLRYVLHLDRARVEHIPKQKRCPCTPFVQGQQRGNADTRAPEYQDRSRQFHS